jgi:hypothetical protein
MINLSPAAQAVLIAAQDAYGYNYSDFHCCADRVAAASLRAVVKHLSYQLPFEDASCIDVVDLLAIADELDDVKYGTYRSNLSDKPK